MNRKLKIVTIFGTRPEIIRLSRIFSELDKYFCHIMIHTHQNFNYETDQIFFNQMKIREPDYSLSVKADSLAKQISNIISQSEEILIKEKPDCVLILGDTNSSLAAIVVKRMHIPIFHMEAGNRSFDENVPEEINRRIIDHISDINLPYSENARQNLILEGIRPETIFVTGSPLLEVFNYYRRQIEKSNILMQLGIKKKKYFVASLHREENVEKSSSLLELAEALNAIAKGYEMSVIFSVHPRTKKRLEQEKIKFDKRISLQKPFGYLDYIKLMQNSFCVISDSGTILEECSIIGFPAIQARTSSERPEAYDEGSAILSGLNKDMILQAIEIIVDQFNSGKKFKVPYNYQESNVSGKIIRIIASQTKKVLKKYDKQ